MKTSALKTILIIAFISFVGIAYSQPMGPPPKGKQDRQQEKKENIEAMKIAFITTKLDLTPEEAQKFWPVYNQYNDKINEMRKQQRMDDRENKKNFDELTDKDIEEDIDADLAFKQKELDMQKEYTKKLKTVLPIRKISKLYEAENQFKKVLIEKLKDNKQTPVGH